MKRRCTNFQSNCQGILSRIGHYVRRSDGQRIQRWRCHQCGVSTSDARRSLCYRQNKRHLNTLIEKLLCSAVSQRRIALILNISRQTVERKFRFLVANARLKNQKISEETLRIHPAKEIFMDEMEDRIHTKCKPAAIAIAVTRTRKILSLEVSKMRPKNRRLNAICRKKYPEWKPNLEQGFESLLKRIRPEVTPDVTIVSDQKHFYAKIIQKVLPKSLHIRHKSRQAVVSGQGELKEGGRDPLFAINHTCASLRANVNRLIRRTWCTSKRLENLQAHLEIYQAFHNTYLT